MQAEDPAAAFERDAGTLERTPGALERDAAERTVGEHPIVLFDGVCNLCHGFVRFIVAHDRGDRFRFAPLDSDVGIALLRRHGYADRDADTVVLVDGDGAHDHSAAALRIARQLDGPWRALVVLGVLPSPLLDALYRFVARNRYGWFGRRDECPIPSAEQRARFLA